ncbi:MULTISPECIES: HEAT repeat domain-containing protein [Parachlamydia]|jgi:HEAT repeat protein|uniref:HEAT repeat domain-containing protein n=2 Tax=Parachlamydia acanthamoebae TaxID=83552 RepID=F8L193_PARAV|nr:HEAT repeat domain-containing protein [Parachlamydia acanthamoebae]EFB40636.1 hypothetical protein pah_c197o006 [Parachlamydia acanthamoebae str. Hall's coccus]KIA77277.1 hypothetical protein DB43_GP00060 [Parachlamydia acanthamoebae]CCB87018.1 putative uncharacterized protein [Parachlamydia acanthamoebae UV-7]
MKCIFFALALCLYSSQILSSQEWSEDIIVKRIHAHLVLNDTDEACSEALQGIQAFPHSIPIHKAYIHALSAKGDEKEILAIWKAYQQLAPDRDSRQISEEIAWGVIHKGAASSSPIIRVISLLAAFFSQDARGVSLLARHFNDSNAFIRRAIVELSANMRDDILCKNILLVLRQEKNWKVYQEAIQAAGEMKIFDAKPDLIKILTDDKSMLEEKISAAIALSTMVESISHEQLHELVRSNRVGLRLLACQLVYRWSLIDELDEMLYLTTDSHAQVRAIALQVLGLLGRTEKYREQTIRSALRLVNDRDPEVVIPAAWILVLTEHPQGEIVFKQLLKNPEQEIQVKAAGALSSTGKYGIPLLQYALRRDNAPFVRLNAALGLIHQQIDVEKACAILEEGLKEHPERWMWEEFGVFKALAASTIKHDEDIPCYPESVDQSTRLEILNILAIMESPKAQEAIKHFLKEKRWGVSGMASILLLTEGDEEALSIIETLIDDPDPQIHIQAALILALWGRGEKAINTLQAAYPQASRDLKEKILEGLGRVGSETSIPFLIEQLEEPFQSLRIIAASSLLQCLYH